MPRLLTVSIPKEPAIARRTGPIGLLTTMHIPPNMPAGRSRSMTGQVIGHYRVIEKIGSGAMGEVFRARDERLGRDVALKLIRPASSANPDHLRRFELEAPAAAALSHPTTVPVYH